ncbi:MAG: ankyrin repeat domain-containing protein [Sphingomonas sp.]|jgi:ankyrin repeat protein|uniref:ankyrin repeat domain-containing protein n=1 Tax=Sphingomonas sp. TaxID=28214 RepID=UPI0035683366
MYSRTTRIRGGLLAAALIVTAAPAVAQLGQSDSYQFLQAIRDSKGDEVEKLLNKPGTVIIDTHDRTTGETALHIVVKRGDDTYLRYLLARGADPNAKDGEGNTPLILASSTGGTGMVDLLVKGGANVDLANGRGETPLIRAVQRRDLAMVRALLAAGADPDQSDRIAGLSARDYAHQDTRTPALAKVIDEHPKKPKRAISGPHF